MFEDPAPLRFRTLDILRTLAKSILNDLSHEEVSIQHNTGAGLIIRAFDGADSPLTGSTKAAKKIKVANACERCRKRKTGCDGYLPCGTCVKQRHECRYAPGVSAPLRPSTASPPPNDVPLPTPPEPSPRIQQQHQSFRMDRFTAAAAATTTTTSSSAAVTMTYNPSTPMASPPTTICPAQHCMSIDPSGHFMGETSFYVNNASDMSLGLPTKASVFPLLEIPNLSIEIQSMLVEYYCTRVDPFFPSILSQHRILIELDHCRTGQPSTLSPLFFYGLFARAIAASHDDNSNYPLNAAATIDPSLSQHLLHIALKNRDEYYDTPHFSTVLALVIIANQLEHSKLEKHLTRAWLLVGEAVRLAIDMGLHRIFRFRHHTKENDFEAQWCIRTFWSLLVTERTMSMTYGRPSILDEKDMQVSIMRHRIDIPLPEYIASEDDEYTADYIKSLRYMTVMSNIAGKIIRYNYSVQTQLPGAFKTNATMSTVDTWLSSECQPLEEYLANIRGSQTRKSWLNGLEALYFMHNLIQAHRPFVNQDSGTKAPFARPSFEICFLAAIIISYVVYTIPHSELIQLSMSPPTLHVVVMALRIHLANASSHESDRRTTIFSEISFDKTMARLDSLPIIANNIHQASTLSRTLEYLKVRYQQRSQSIVSGYASTSQQQKQLSMATTSTPNDHGSIQVASSPYKSSTDSISTSTNQPFTFIAFHSDGSTHRRVSSSPSSSRRRQQRQHSNTQTPSTNTPSSPPGYGILEIPTPALPSSTLDMYNNQSDYFFPAPEGDPDLPSSILPNNEFHYF
ncbi:hypothetical protein K492DRAFT_209726 [Lichtheimia hyalospora FSU 10163]|nr:hypothetical protein K492DRAFT_209726 [Lichtheimia hyalospora FSU 10163]